ncbi:MAG: S4 domain-containing protein, partial [Candidatus Fonsibacter sp.]
MESDGVRVSKYLSNLGYGSRREIEKLIAQNKIYVNNKLIKTP